MSTGAAGVYAQIPLDTTTSLVPALGATLVAGEIRVDAGARYCLSVSAGIVAQAGCDGGGVRVKVDGTVIARSESTGLTVAAGSLITRSITTMLNLEPDQILAVEVMSSGVGSCAISSSADVTAVVLSAI